MGELQRGRRGPCGASSPASVSRSLRLSVLPEAFEALGCCEECLPGRQTGTYPEQAVPDVSHHLVGLVGGQQPQGEGAPLVLDGQLQGVTTS